MSGRSPRGLRRVVGVSGSGGRGPARGPVTAAGVLGRPAGTGIVGAAAAVFIGVALYEGYRRISCDSLDDSKSKQMSRAIRRWIEWIGTVGHLARMVVFGFVAAGLAAFALSSLSDARYRTI